MSSITKLSERIPSELLQPHGEVHPRIQLADVANAIFDGTSAVMLSGETAIGAFPIDSVRVMAATAEFAEAHLPFERLLREAIAANATSATEAISQGIAEIATDLSAVAILCSTSSGETARQFARLRLALPIIAATHNLSTYRQLTLLWGVCPLLVAETTNGEAKAITGNRSKKSAK